MLSMRFELRDWRHAWRTLVKSPGFSLTTLLTIGIGIGAVTASFALVNAILIQPLRYPESERLVAVKHAAPGLGLTEAGLSSGTYFHYRRNAKSLEDLAVYEETVLNLSGSEGVTERVEVAYAGPELFQLLKVKPALGRLFTTEDGRPGFLDTRWKIPILISHELWISRYGSDPEIIGRSIMLNQREREVIGVLPAGFAFPRPETRLWMLSMPAEATADFARQLRYSAIARLRPSATPEAAKAELGQLLTSMEGAYPDATAARMAEVRLSPIVVSLRQEIVGNVGNALWLLFGGMAFLLLVMGANVSNLFLLRSDQRARETAVRTAIGAQAGDLLRMFLRESLLLSMAGSAIALLLAYVSLTALVVYAPVELPRLAEVQLDLRVFAFTWSVALLAALLFGGIAFLRHSRMTRIAPALKNGGWGATDSPESRVTRKVLVAVQVGFTLNLLIGSGLMLQTFWKLTNTEAGFEPAGVLTVEIGLPGNRASTHERIYGGLLERIRALPGVVSAAAGSSLPLAGGGYSYPFRPLQSSSGVAPAESPVSMKFFMPGYFQSMQIPVLQGDTLAANSVAVSETLARRLFPGESPIGRKILRLGSDGKEVTMFDPATQQARAISSWTISSVVADVRETSLRKAPNEIVYVPIGTPRVEPSIMPTTMHLIVRTGLPPLSLAASVRKTIADYDAAVSVGKIRTMDAIVRASTARERFLAVLLLIAGIASTLLGAVGIYGVVAQTARRRRQEIGIRVALGAQVAHVVGLAMRESSLATLAGLALGVAAALATTRALGSLLFEVTSLDAFTFAAATLLLLTVAILSGFLPALRSARVNPMTALRSD
jgi:putative ABC transport system permease protein